MRFLRKILNFIFFPFRWIWKKILAKHTALIEKRIKREIEISLSHELRTPLTCILAYSEMLAENVKSKENIEAAKVIYNKSKEMVRLIDNLIEISVLDFNPQSVYKTQINLSNTVIAAINKFKFFYEDYDDFAVFSEVELNIEVPGNKKLFTLMFFEILNNAYFYKKPSEKAIISVSLKQSNNHAILKIRDNGIGIKDKFKKRIFERFFRTENGDTADTSGMGIGLSLVKKIVELFDGTINLQSTWGEGSEFTIVLPTKKQKHFANILRKEKFDED
jgi:signal transduction histidine kinase